MRLLQVDGYPNFSLAEFAEAEVPPYAILSHTWGHDSDEVTYKDIIDGTGGGKAGYDKLHFCAEQAKKDGLGYYWIDTCCIDKTSAAELTESINSMFRWYQNAIKCYVFLTDVSTPTSDDDRDSQLRKSRWFIRGWTLQELIAPRCVEFFSQERERLGDKKLLEKQIHQITGISTHALRGEPLSHFSIDERMSWAANRSSKRPEDKVYSLLGIFDIHMEAIYGEGEHHASRRLKREVERYSKNHQPSEVFRDPVQLPLRTNSETALVNPIWIVPFERNPRFTGREPELTRLEEMLLGGHRTAKLAITGLGGVGKTQLLIELLYRVADKQKYDLVIWISAVNMESLHQSYLDVARQLGIPGFEDDKADVKRLVQAHLSKQSTGQWLLVFDNADDIDMWIANAGSKQQSGNEQGVHSAPGLQPLINYLPKSKQGAIVFTTRDRKIAVKLAQQCVVEMPALGEDAATQLLRKCLVNPDLISCQQDTSALLSQLTCLPLAIVQAAAYINENSISLADYLSLLAEQEEEVIDLLSEEFEDDGRYHNIKNPVATTWLISFDQLRRRDKLAADYLSFMACIEPKDIPLSLLPPLASRKKEIDAIGTLTAYSFINKRPADECLDLHRLVHLATRNWLRKEELLAQSTEQAILRLNEVFPDHEHHNRAVWRKYLAHASYVLEGDVAIGNTEARTNLLWKLGACLFQDGRWVEAKELDAQVLEARKQALGAEHPETLTCMANLAMVYSKLGQCEIAEELEEEVIEVRKRLLGPEHPDTLISMSNLASTRWQQGRWDLAEKLFLEVTEIREKVLGADHSDTLVSMHNLAVTYSYKGYWDKAEEMQVKLVEIGKEKFGEEHPTVLIFMNQLASTYSRQGRLGAAGELGLRVMEMSKKMLGETHPDTLVSISNLASMYRNKSQWNKAEELDIQVMELRKKLFGLEHPDTLTSMSNLALTYRNQGRFDEAEELGVQVIQIRNRVLGTEHQDTLTSMANLAITYNDKGRFDEAEALGLQVIETGKRILGPEHPDVLISMGNLALTYTRKNRWKEAEELELQVMELRKKLFGLEHPDTLTSMNNLALTYRNQGRFDEAEELGEQVIRIRNRVLGTEHQDTLTSMANLAITYNDKGRFDEAEELGLQAMETRKRILGPEHPAVLTSMGNLALTYTRKDRWKEAEELELQVMEACKRKLGVEHPDTLISMGNLSVTWKVLGREAEALELLSECVRLMDRVLGASHPDFLSFSTRLREWQSADRG